MRVQIYVIKQKKKKKKKRQTISLSKIWKTTQFFIFNRCKEPLKIVGMQWIQSIQRIVWLLCNKKKKKKKLNVSPKKIPINLRLNCCSIYPPPAIDWGRDSRIRWLHLDREVRTPPHNECPRYDTKLYLMVRFQSRCFGNEKYPFMVITLRFTLSRIGNTC